MKRTTVKAALKRQAGGSFDRPAPTNPQGQERITRRELLKGAVGLGAAAVLSSSASPAERSVKVARAPRRDDVLRENRRPGTRDWLLTKTGIDPKTKYRCPWIEGYCSRTSVRAGESLELFVSTNPPSPFTIDLYRMGYYGGAGGRH